MVAADTGVAVVPGPFLLEPAGLADGGVQIDGQGIAAGPRSGRPGPLEQFAADPVELAHGAPGEAAQERAQGGRRLDPEAQHPARATGPQRIGIIDDVAARERRQHQRQELVADVGPAHCRPQVEVLIDQLPEAQMLCQGGRQQEPGSGHQAVVVEGRVEPVEAVG